MSNKITIEWDKESECFIAQIEGSDLIGCGETHKEALAHLMNHIKDEQETPRKKSGRLANVKPQ